MDFINLFNKLERTRTIRENPEHKNSFIEFWGYVHINNYKLLRGRRDIFNFVYIKNLGIRSLFLYLYMMLYRERKYCNKRSFQLSGLDLFLALITIVLSITSTMNPMDRAKSNSDTDKTKFHIRNYSINVKFKNKNTKL